MGMFLSNKTMGTFGENHAKTQYEKESLLIEGNPCKPLPAVTSPGFEPMMS